MLVCGRSIGFEDTTTNHAPHLRAPVDELASLDLRSLAHCRRHGHWSYPVTLSLSPGVGAGQKQQSKLADLHHVAVGRHSRVHRFAVDVGAVEAADVDNLEFAAYATELGVPPADRDVVEEDVAIRMTTGRRGGPVVHVKDA
jgi:hypothetical protein